MTVLLKPVFTARSFAGEPDVLAIADLINTCDAVDQLELGTSIEELRVELSDPDFDLARDLRLWKDAQGQLTGYGWMWLPPETDDHATESRDGFLRFQVRPNARDQGLEDQIIAWAAEQMRAIARTTQKPVNLRVSARDSQAKKIAFLEQHDFTVVRHFYRMTRSLTEPLPMPQLPVGYTVRSLTYDAVAAWVEMFNQTFIDHWNFHPSTPAQRQRWLTEPDYDADLDLVAIAPDGTFAAFCFGSIEAEDNTRTGRKEGWISDLGTRRGFRQIGLGRAMLLSGLHQLKAKGIDTALLGVDSENPCGALQLYESVGFRPLFTSLAYCKTIGH